MKNENYLDWETIYNSNYSQSGNDINDIELILNSMDELKEKFEITEDVVNQIKADFIRMFVLDGILCNGNRSATSFGINVLNGKVVGFVYDDFEADNFNGERESSFKFEAYRKTVKSFEGIIECLIRMNKDVKPHIIDALDEYLEYFSDEKKLEFYPNISVIKEQISKFRKIYEVEMYIRSIQDEEPFKKIAALYSNMDSEHIKRYLEESDNDYENYEHFKKFYEIAKRYYENPSLIKDSDIYDAYNSKMYLDSRTYAGGGNFIRSIIILPFFNLEANNFVSCFIKDEVPESPQHGILNKNHHLILASEIISKYTGKDVRTAKYFPIGDNKNMTQNFLLDRESTRGIDLYLGYERCIENAESGLEISLVRQYSQKNVSEEDSKARAKRKREDYIKLEFLYKFIENKDDVLRNVGMVFKDGIVSGIAAYDFDYTFDVFDLGNYCDEMKLKDGKSDVKSYVEAFKREGWFLKFVRDFYSNFSIDTIIEEMTKTYSFVHFDEVELKHYREFLDRQLVEVREGLGPAIDEQRQREF